MLVIGPGSEPLRVLSLWQPWATLCVAPDPSKDGKAAPKEFETRSWPPRGPLPIRVAIHATKRMDRHLVELLTEWPFRDCLMRCGFFPGDPRPWLRRNISLFEDLRLLPLGAIVGVATIARVESCLTRRTRFGRLERDYEEYALGDWSDGRYAWALTDTAMLSEPIPFTGRQSALYELPADVELQVWEQLAGAEVTPC